MGKVTGQGKDALTNQTKRETPTLNGGVTHLRRETVTVGKPTKKERIKGVADSRFLSVGAGILGLLGWLTEGERGSDKRRRFESLSSKKGGAGAGILGLRKQGIKLFVGEKSREETNPQ